MTSQVISIWPKTSSEVRSSVLVVEVDDDFEVDDELELVDNDDVGLPEEVELVFMQKMELKLSSKFAA